MNLNRSNLYLGIFTLSGVLILGLINIATPFFGDQAFFLLGAKEMNEGHVLYRDFWDIKQPGIFFFFLIAGKLFGFSYVGVHLFELTYWLIFTIVLLWFLQTHEVFHNKLLPYLLPLTIVGTYYSVVSLRSMTQVEILVNFPLMLVLIFNTLYLENKKYAQLWLFFSGLFGGIALLFKIIFAPVLIVFWLILFIKDWNVKPISSVFYKSGIILSGIILAWIPFIFYCFHYDLLELCYNTFIKMPPLVLKFAQSKSVNELLHSVYSYFSKVILFVPFVFYSLLLMRRRFSIELWGWMIAGIIVVILQKNSWYSYHFQLLYTPIIFLSFISVDVLISKMANKLNLTNYVITYSILFFINAFSIFHLVKKIVKLSEYNFVLSANDRLSFAISQKDNAAAYRISGYLTRQKEEDCDIFVVNDPLVYYYTNRNQSTAQSGWSMHLFIPGQTELLQQELEKSKPCYIFLRKSFDPFFKSKGSEILKWINQNYLKSFSDADGTWYKLN